MKRLLQCLALGLFFVAVGPATAQAETPDRYWLKGMFFSPDKEECGVDCPAGAYLLLNVIVEDGCCSRQAGGTFPGEFGFGAPLDPNIKWRIEIPRQPDFYKCYITRGASGTVIPDERAINIAFAMHVTDITCDLNADGRKEWKRLADIRNPPKRTLDRAFVIGRWGTSGGCAQAAEMRADGAFILPIGEGRWELNGDRITYFWRGTANTARVWVIDDNTMGAENAEGEINQTKRC